MIYWHTLPWDAYLCSCHVTKSCQWVALVVFLVLVILVVVLVAMSGIVGIVGFVVCADLSQLLLLVLVGHWLLGKKNDDRSVSGPSQDDDANG